MENEHRGAKRVQDTEERAEQRRQRQRFLDRVVGAAMPPAVATELAELPEEMWGEIVVQLNVWEASRADLRSEGR